MSNTKNKSELLITAIQAYFLHKKRSAEANLENYLYNSVAIGEHGDIVSECVKLIEQIDHAESCLSIVDTYIPAVSNGSDAMV
mgnify:CR=1 FL=1